MEISKQAVNIYESSRNLLLNTEPVRKEIEEIISPVLREKLLEIIRTIQADLLILNDVLIDVMNSESEADIEFILQATDETFHEVVNSDGKYYS